MIPQSCALGVGVLHFATAPEEAYTLPVFSSGGCTRARHPRARRLGTGLTITGDRSSDAHPVQGQRNEEPHGGLVSVERLFFFLSYQEDPMKDRYSGRGPGIVVKALSLDRDAAEVIEEYASSYANQGQFVSALALAERARREERARLKAAVLAALEPEARDERQE